MDDPKLSNESSSKLAVTLEINKKTILERWELLTRQEVPASRDKPDPALLDSISAVIDKMIDTLSVRSPGDKLKEEEKNLARDHGKLRAMMNDYSLDQVITEYSILREVIFDVIDPKGDMTLKQGKTLWDSIFIAIRNASTEFSKTREYESEINYKAIIDSVGDYAVLTLDLDGIITSWNQGCIRMKQYSAEEVIGKNYSMFFTEDAKLRNEPKDHLSTAKKEGRYRGKGIRVRKNGEEFMADVYIVPQKKNNEVVGYAKIVADMTKHNKLTQDRDLSQSEASDLKIEQKMRESFVSTLTHDLRNPLAVAKMSAELMLRFPENEEKVLLMTSKIIKNISRTDKMISDLLDANRIRAGEKIPLNLQECNLTKLAHDVCDELSMVHGDRIKVNANKDIMGFWDYAGLTRILENLTTNALKYGEASAAVTISLEEVMTRVLIKVHNFGKVIELPDQAAMFDQYYRTKNAQEGTVKGWGLGLTLVKGLVEAHGGKVRVESYPMKGTTFTVDLPLNKKNS